ncbi:UNVERIFIED_CONTAM: hypothetical protein Sindi_0046300 [Sesamum indicum]
MTEWGGCREANDGYDRSRSKEMKIDYSGILPRTKTAISPSRYVRLQWEPGMALHKHSHTQVPIWIKLRHLPVESWTLDGFSTIASGVGRPLYQDAITKACTRLDFSCVCVMIDYNSTLPKHLIVLAPNGKGRGHPCRVDVEYECVPSRCLTCCSLGHSSMGCPSISKLMKPPVAVWPQAT